MTKLPETLIGNRFEYQLTLDTLDAEEAANILARTAGRYGKASFDTELFYDKLFEYLPKVRKDPLINLVGEDLSFPEQTVRPRMMRAVVGSIQNGQIEDAVDFMARHDMLTTTVLVNLFHMLEDANAA
jgi:hypothetical protein